MSNYSQSFKIFRALTNTKLDKKVKEFKSYKCIEVIEVHRQSETLLKEAVIYYKKKIQIVFLYDNFQFVKK